MFERSMGLAQSPVFWALLCLQSSVLVLGAGRNLGHTSTPAAIPAKIYRLDFCRPESWQLACQDHPRRRDIFCGERFAVMRKTLTDYCAKHMQAIEDINTGKTTASSYKYVMSSYHHSNGLGNRLPGMVSGFYLALMTDRLFIHDYEGYDKYFDCPFKAGFREFWGGQDPRGMGQPTVYPHGFMHENYTMTNIMIAGDLQELYGNYTVWNIGNHADYHAAPLSANKYFREKMKAVFPTNELFWPLSLFIFRYTARLQQLVEDFQVANYWGNHAVIGVQMRTIKIGDGPEVFHRFSDLTRSLIAEARGQSKPIMVFLSSDLQRAYREMRERLKDQLDIKIMSTAHEQLIATNETVGFNPGTEDSALLDLALLSHSTMIIISGSSSFGGCAAGLGGLHPYYITQLDNSSPGSNSYAPQYWKATSSEPCHYQGWWNDHYLTPEALALWREHPLHNQWRQCHNPHGGPETEEQKQVKIEDRYPH